MSKNRRQQLKNASEQSLPNLPADISETVPDKSPRFAFLKHWWVVGLMALLMLGAFGAGMKYLEDSAKQQAGQSISSDKQNAGSYLSALNPFVPNPTPSPTPQLSKEYIYAGSRMLAVEDANANAAPPADLAVWRPSTGYWHVLGGQGSQATNYQWGASTDTTVPGDYDGDGKTDFSVFRVTNGTGNWFIVKSSDGTSYSLQFGASGDLIAQADYDGDGKTDAAVFRPSNGTWYIQRSQAGFTSQAFGISSDIPAPADYDGDGKADIALWRGIGYTFYILKSSDGTGISQTITGSNSTDTPVSGDYDGDGKADIALLSTASTWLIRKSSDGVMQSISWGQPGEEAVQNDYDGDGKVDIAVWRASNGNWYIRQSTSANSLRQEAWGMAGDKPVPAYYRR